MSSPHNKSILIDTYVSQPISPGQMKKMIFIFNALENGWSVKKLADSYIFTKKHEGKREVFCENYLETFVRNNCDVSL